VQYFLWPKTGFSRFLPLRSRLDFWPMVAVGCDRRRRSLRWRSWGSSRQRRVLRCWWLDLFCSVWHRKVGMSTSFVGAGIMITAYERALCSFSEFIFHILCNFLNISIPSKFIINLWY